MVLRKTHHAELHLDFVSQWRSGPLLWPFPSGFGLSQLGGRSPHRDWEAVLHQRLQVSGAAARSVSVHTHGTLFTRIQWRSNVDTPLVWLQGTGSVPLILRPAWRMEKVTWVWDRWSPVPRGRKMSWSCSTPADRPVLTKARRGSPSSASSVTKTKLWVVF